MIAKGAVEIVFCNNNEDNNSYKTTKVLNKGDWFGEIAFFIGSPRISSLRS